MRVLQKNKLLCCSKLKQNCYCCCWSVRACWELNLHCRRSINWRAQSIGTIKFLSLFKCYISSMIEWLINWLIPTSFLVLRKELGVLCSTLQQATKFILLLFYYYNYDLAFPSPLEFHIFLAKGNSWLRCGGAEWVIEYIPSTYHKVCCITMFRSLLEFSVFLSAGKSWASCGVHTNRPQIMPISRQSSSDNYRTCRKTLTKVWAISVI